MAYWRFNRFALQFARLLTAPPSFDKLMIANDLGETAIDRVGSLEEFAHGRIRKLNDALCIGNEHAIRHLLKDVSKAGALGI